MFKSNKLIKYYVEKLRERENLKGKPICGLFELNAIATSFNIRGYVLFYSRLKQVQGREKFFVLRPSLLTMNSLVVIIL